MAVYVKRQDMPYLEDVRKAYRTRDKMDLPLGLKGGVQIQFKLYQTEFSFINCHLAAH